MSLRIPTLSEVLGLFFRPATVAGATKLLSDTAARLDEVAKHHIFHADRKFVKAGQLKVQALDLEQQAVDHQKEIGRASSVAAKLEALLS